MIFPELVQGKTGNPCKPLSLAGKIHGFLQHVPLNSVVKETKKSLKARDRCDLMIGLGVSSTFIHFQYLAVKVAGASYSESIVEAFPLDHSVAFSCFMLFLPR